MYELRFWVSGCYVMLVDPDGEILAEANTLAEGKQLRVWRDQLNGARSG